MFEVPVSYHNKRIATERKIRYQFVNILNRKYHGKKRKIRQHREQLPTPENSAVENNGSSSEAREMVIKRKLTMGEECSDLDLSEEEEEEQEQENEESDNEHHTESGTKFEKLFFKKYEKPEHSFEVWSDESVPGKSKKVELKRTRVSYTHLNRVQKAAKRKIESSTVHMPLANKRYFDIKCEGYEVLEPLVRTEGYQLKQIETLTQILFINVSRGNWDIAYKTFSILIRIPEVDIRNIWGLGTRILMEKGQTTRSLEFLKWMSTVYSSKINFVQSRCYRTPPVFRSGSKTHSPKYATTWLWNSLIRATEVISLEEEGKVDREEEIDPSSYKKSSGMDRIAQLIDRLSEMVLVPPYMEDPEVWFIYSMCHMVKADYLSSNYDGSQLSGSGKDIARNQVTQHIHYVKTYLQNCVQKGNFEYPKQFIEGRLKEFESRMYRETPSKSVATANNSDSEDGIDNVGYEDNEQQYEDNPFEIEEDNSFSRNYTEEEDPIIKTHWEPAINVDNMQFYNEDSDSD